MSSSSTEKGKVCQEAAQSLIFTHGWQKSFFFTKITLALSDVLKTYTLFALFFVEAVKHREAFVNQCFIPDPYLLSLLAKQKTPK